MLKTHIKKYKHHYFWGFFTSSVFVLFIFLHFVLHRSFSQTTTCNQLYTTTVSDSNAPAGKPFTCWVETVSSSYANTTCAMTNDPTPLGNWYKNIWNICTFSSWTTMSDGHPAASFTCTIPISSQFSYASDGYKMFGVNFGTCSNSNPTHLPYVKIGFNGIPVTPTIAPTLVSSISTPFPTYIPTPTQFIPTATLIPPTPTRVPPTLTSLPHTANTVQTVSPTPTIYQSPSDKSSSVTTVNYATATPKPTPTPVLIINEFTTDETVPTYNPIPTEIKRTTASVIQSYPTSIVQTQTPATQPTLNPTTYGFRTPMTNVAILGNKAIELIGQPDATVDLQLQPASETLESIYIGRGRFNGLGNVSINWDSTNTPNGTYKLYALFHQNERPDIVIGPQLVSVQNPQASSIKQVALPNDATPSKIATFPVDTHTDIRTIKNVKTMDNYTALSISGKSTPNTFVTLVIYSTPILVTVKTDSNGQWSYTLEKPLSPGEHTTYALVTDHNGENIRSQVAQFFIASAFAQSSNNESLNLASPSENNSYILYISIVAMMVVLGILTLSIIYSRKLRTIRIQ